MSQHELNQAIAAVREQQPEEAVVRGAAGRVFSGLFQSAFLPETVNRIRGCSDFQALIPGYLSRSLTPSRTLLFEDHIRSCVDCRRVLHEAQGQEAPASGPTIRTRQQRVPVIAWALAATLAVGIATGLIGARYGLLPGQSAARATVSNIEGTLYRVTSFGSALVKVGELITSADDLRTASGSRAILRLAGGGELELGERSDVSLSREWRGTTVNLEQGRLIASAPNPGTGEIYLSGGGVVVPVSNAVVAFDRGTKGARVALAQGSAKVTQGRTSFALSAGQQMSTSGLEKAPIATEFAWSQNAASYLSLLSEFSTLQKELQNIPSPGLRYSSSLAKYVPGGAVLYAAIPNLGGTLSEAKRIFDDRLAQSSVLRDWWGQKSTSRSADFDRAITQISSISQYLGDEIVLAIASTGAHSYGEPVLLANVRNSGLAEYLQQNVPAAAGIQVLTSLSQIPAGPKGHLLVLIDKDILIASTDVSEVRQAAQSAGNPDGSFTASPFYARIAKSYAGGAGYLLAVDLEQIVQKSVSTSKEASISGLGNAQYLVLERRDLNGATDTRVALSFSSARQGVASWLGAPGPMGSLDFVSPNASFATAFVMKNPRDVVTELIASATQNDPNFSQQLSSFESEAGVALLDDVAAPFGRDVTLAMDGPLLPVPSWKLVVEVNDPSRLQQTLATLIGRLNQHLAGTGSKLQLDQEQVNSRTFYSLRNQRFPNLAAYFTFVDGYLLAGPSEANLVQAIQNRQAGYTLVSSPAFRNQMPVDNYTNSSAIVYTNVAGSFGPLAEQVKGATALSPAQQQALSTIIANSGPGLICVYGEPDRIVAATRGSFLGFNLGTLAGIQQGRPMLPLIASSMQSAASGAHR